MGELCMGINKSQYLINLFEAQFSPPKVMFHGTSSIFLRKILKIGLIPDPKERGWDEFSTGEWNTPSLQSYHGVYLTDIVGESQGAAFHSVDKFGGNDVYVIAQIQPRSAIPDEDSIVLVMDSYAALKNDQIVQNLYAHVFGLPNNPQGKNPALYKRAYESWKYMFMDALRLSPRRKNTIPEPLYQSVFNHWIKRRMAYLAEQQYNIPDWLEKILPDKYEAEQQFRRVFDMFLRKVKSVIQTDQRSHTMRLTTPLTYRGINKILAVYENITTKTDRQFNKYVFKIHYGKVVSEFKQKFQNIVNYKVVFV
jgi:hypothetical protein